MQKYSKVLFIFLTICGASALYFINNFVSDADNYISKEIFQEMWPDEMEAQYLEYLNLIGISEEELTLKIDTFNNELQTALDQTFILNKIALYYEHSKNLNSIKIEINKNQEQQIKYIKDTNEKVSNLNESDKIIYQQIAKDTFKVIGE